MATKIVQTSKGVRNLFFGLVSLVLFVSANAWSIPVWINEFHYDNAGADSGEFVEVAGLAGTDLSGYEIVLYNGSGGAPYGTLPLSGVLTDQMNGFGTLSFAAPGMQNGAPDGMALFDGSSVLQFLSYEGSFTAVGGPADGLTSTDIGVAEGSSTAIGDSLQLIGTGSVYGDFTWSDPPTQESPGSINVGQSFVASTVPEGSAGWAGLGALVLLLLVPRRWGLAALV